MHILGHVQAKWHVQEPVPTTVSGKSGQVGGFLIKVYVQEAVLCVQLTEASSTT